MRVSLLLPLLAVVVLGGCDSSDMSPEADRIVKQVGCTDMVVQASPADPVSEGVTCSLRGEPVNVLIFESQKDMDAWLDVPSDPGERQMYRIHGDAWVVEVAGRKRAVAISGRVEGSQLDLLTTP